MGDKKRPKKAELREQAKELVEREMEREIESGETLSLTLDEITRLMVEFYRQRGKFDR